MFTKYLVWHKNTTLLKKNVKWVLMKLEEALYLVIYVAYCIGPMVYGCVFWPIDKKEKCAKIGFNGNLFLSNIKTQKN